MNKIRQLRNAKGLTQDALAKALGLDRSTVTKWEIGESVPRVATLIKLSKIFKCSIDTIVKQDKYM